MPALMALAFVMLLGATHAAFAQESRPPAGVFGFADARPAEETWSNSRLNVRPGLQLVELRSPAEQAAARATIRGVSPVRLGPFGRAYPFTRLRVYLGRVAPPEAERGGGDQARPVLLVSADDRRGRARWWRFAVSESGDEDDYFTISDEPDESEQIGPAADPTIPLVLVQYGHAGMGASTRSSSTTQVLLDFRTAAPNVLAGFDAWRVEGGGACGVYDNGSGLKIATSCAWNTQRGDFLCTERGLRDDVLWTARTMTRQYWLTNDHAAGAGSSDAATAVAPSVERLANAPDGSVTAAVPGLGSTRHLADGVLAGGARYRLFAAPGTSKDLDARIVAVMTRPGEAARLVTVGRSARVESESSSSSDWDEAPAGAVAEQEATFRAIRVDGGGDTPDAAIYKVIVDEGAGRSLFLVAIAAAQDTPRLDTFRLATNADAYDACARSAVPETAVRADIVIATPFTIEMDVEPRRRENLVDVDPEDDERNPTFEATETCAWRGAIRWTPDAGFAVEKVADVCGAQARRAVISDDGSLSAAAVYQRIETPDHAVRYLALGRGEPAVLLLSDPDFAIRLWEPVMEQLARRQLTVAVIPRPWGQPTGNVLEPLANHIQAVVEAVQAKRVFVVAHGLAAGYAVEWAAAHRDRVAGLLVLHPIESHWSQSPRLGALLGSPEARQAYVRTVLPGSPHVDAIAATMRDRSHTLDPTWLQVWATLLAWQFHDTPERLKGLPIWVAGHRAVGNATVVQSPGAFAMVEDPATMAAFLQTLVDSLAP